MGPAKAGTNVTRIALDTVALASLIVQPTDAICLSGRILMKYWSQSTVSVKYPEAQPTGTFSRGKELPHRQPSHDV